jgi:hypothetical protein
MSDEIGHFYTVGNEVWSDSRAWNSPRYVANATTREFACAIVMNQRELWKRDEERASLRAERDALRAKVLRCDLECAHCDGLAAERDVALAQVRELRAALAKIRTRVGAGVAYAMGVDVIDIAHTALANTAPKEEA